MDSFRPSGDMESGGEEDESVPDLDLKGTNNYGENVLSRATIDAAGPGVSGSIRSSPLPITSPARPSGISTFENRRMGSAASSAAQLDSNPPCEPEAKHIISSPSPSTDSQSRETPWLPIRKSLTKSLSVGPPVPAGEEVAGISNPFAPSSFPSSSMTFPPAPHDASDRRDVDARGKVISAAGDAGADRMRHTRVYGGGVCLACRASECEGGFYGERVRPEERRY